MQRWTGLLGWLFCCCCCCWQLLRGLQSKSFFRLSAPLPTIHFLPAQLFFSDSPHTIPYIHTITITKKTPTLLSWYTVFIYLLHSRYASIIYHSLLSSPSVLGPGPCSSGALLSSVSLFFGSLSLKYNPPSRARRGHTLSLLSDRRHYPRSANT